MDPDETLHAIRQACSDYLEYICADQDKIGRFTDEFVDLVISLDEWISNGGFLPSEWNKTVTK